jgi:hydrogenase nickel incorporation protein HypA/HybF
LLAAARVHELSIAVGLVDAACEERARLGGSPVIRALRVRIGPLAGVAEEALRFSFDVAREGTAIAGVRLEIERVPLTGFCPGCRAVRPIASVVHFVCTVCGEPIREVRSGRELELRALEIEE